MSRCPASLSVDHENLSSGILTTWHIPSYDVIYPHMTVIWPHIPCYVIWGHMGSYDRHMTPYTFWKSIWLRLYMTVICRHILFRSSTVYGGIWPSYDSICRKRAFHTGHSCSCTWYKTCPTAHWCCCFRYMTSCDGYMLAHPAAAARSRLHPAGTPECPPECGTFVALERRTRSSTNHFIL